MATDDQQVLVTGQAPAPAHFKVPGNGQVRPKAVFASFDGTNAAGDFQPALKITSDGGEVVGVYPTNATVTAGGSVDVSWFPHVGGGGGATPTGTTLAFAQGFSEFTTGDPVQNVLAGTASNGTNAHVTTTDAGILSWSTTVHTNDTLNFGATGTYLVWASSLWDTSDIALTTTIMNTGVTGFRHDPFLPSAFSAFVASDGLANSQDYAVFHVGLGAGSTHVIHQNGLGVDHAVEGQYLTVVYLGTG